MSNEIKTAEIVRRLRCWERGEYRSDPPGREDIFFTTDARLAADKIEGMGKAAQAARAEGAREMLTALVANGYLSAADGNGASEDFAEILHQVEECDADPLP